ncbi:hypothetical protein OVA13_07580 [Pseudoxanthomonas sp. SL93]|nr:hypothetical protein [Pseudoxanthomonas sp. SL93]WAC64605.1 hypothetical protein OVA13_07580 [Pseudoxanthomonas sp. SL93]
MASRPPPIPLSAPPTLRDPREVELRMRRLLDDAHYLFTLSNVHH